MATIRLVLGVVALFAAGMLLQVLHPLQQPQEYHHFADTRALWLIPNAADVLSNLFISVSGLACLRWVSKQRKEGALLGAAITVAGIGLLLTGVGSGFYHWHPTDARLVWDRLPMTIVFAGMVLCLWSSATLVRPRWYHALMVVAAAVGTVWFWVARGSLWPYALLQFGGIFAMLSLVVRGRVLGASAWWKVMQWYGLAKVFEYFDKELWSWTGHLVSGHTLKHLACAGAGFAILWLAKNSLFIPSK
ncbi:hypothetical protein AS149_32150 [Burkholderia cenocepacia]|nr:hypothetical protein AS149_32150 [Burkholderia cenocepacia]